MNTRGGSSRIFLDLQQGYRTGRCQLLWADQSQHGHSIQTASLAPWKGQSFQTPEVVPSIQRSGLEWDESGLPMMSIESIWCEVSGTKGAPVLLNNWEAMSFWFLMKSRFWPLPVKVPLCQGRTLCHGRWLVLGPQPWAGWFGRLVCQSGQASKWSDRHYWPGAWSGHEIWPLIEPRNGQ